MSLQLRIDTRDKKPNLYSIAYLAIPFSLVVAGIARYGGPHHAVAISGVCALFTLVSIIILVKTFFEQLEYNPYSYNTIYYTGFALFLFSLLCSLILVTALLVYYKGAYGAEQVVYTLLLSAKTYMLLSAPFIFVFSAALCVSNISLIRHEGYRFVNVLGILLSFALVGGEIYLFVAESYVSGSPREIMMRALFNNLFAAGYLYVECMIIGAIVANAIAARFVPDRNKDLIIVLGCGVRPDGTPTPLLRGRADRALAFREQQLAETGKDLIFIASGGKGSDEAVSESTAIRNYLIGQGIAPERVYEENASTSTFENMKFSRQVILKLLADGTLPGGAIVDDPHAAKPTPLPRELHVAFSTTNYHVFRSGLFARRVKMRAQGMGASTKWYFWPNAAVREFVGLLTEHRGKQALVLLGLIVFYATLTVIAYS